MKLSPSYISYFLPLLTLYDIKFAKLFYPYVFGCSFFGSILTIIIYLFENINNYFENYFEDNITFQFEDNPLIYFLLNFIILSYKIVLIKYYPYDFSKKAILYSIYLLIIWFIYYYYIYF